MGGLPLRLPLPLPLLLPLLITQVHERFILFDWEDYDFDDDVCDEVRHDAEEDEYANYDWDDDVPAQQEAAPRVDSPAASPAVDKRSITERILYGNFDLDELASSATQLLPMIELELAIARVRVQGEGPG